MKKFAAIMLAALIIIVFSACEGTPTQAAEMEAPATVKWVQNMMGSNNGTGTNAGNFPTTDAMANGAYFDEDGALHATFYPISNKDFTAYSAGMTGYGYYANYDINIDSLTAASTDDPQTADKDETVGTYLIYTIEEKGSDTITWGTSNSRAKCTKIGDYVAPTTGTTTDKAEKEIKDEDLIKDASYLTDITIKYYVVEGKYERHVNTTTAMPDDLKEKIDGKKPVFTFTVADDSKFLIPPAAETTPDNSEDSADTAPTT